MIIAFRKMCSFRFRQQMKGRFVVAIRSGKLLVVGITVSRITLKLRKFMKALREKVQ